MSEAITPALLRDWPLPQPEGDKHSRGTVLVIGGAAPTVGAVLLTGVAALRAGAGVVQLACAPQVATALAVAVPEALVVAWPADGVGELAEAADVVVVGPGLDDVEHAGRLLDEVTEAAGDLVVDAYALGALSRRPVLLRRRDRWPVLTPSATEAEVLLAGDAPDDLAEAAARITQRYQAVVALRGQLAEPGGRHWHEGTGDVGLGTAGSGDVFAGLVGGLLARGAEPAQAACWAAYLHASAGQRLAAVFGRTGFLARELADESARVLAALQV